MNQASLFDPDPDPAPAPEPGQPEGRGAATASAPPVARRHLVIEADGGSRGNPGPAGFGALVREGGTVLAERAEYLGVASNNVAEYSGLIAGLTAARQIDPTASVEVRMDSKLVVEQMSGRWKIKHEDMRRLARHARDAFIPEQVSYTWIPRAQNGAADALANQVMDSTGKIRTNYPDGAAADAGSDPSIPSPSPTARPGAPETESLLGEEPPVPDLDVDAPSMTEQDVLTLVLLSPGMAAAGDDPLLTEAGMDLAAGAAALVDLVGTNLWPQLPEPSELFSSPLVRAQQTAELVSEVTGLGVPTVDRDLAAASPGEDLASVASRVSRALGRLEESYPGHTVVLAAHADVIAAIIGLAAGVPHEYWGSMRIAPGTLSLVRRWHGGGEVHAVGCPAQFGADDAGTG